MIEVSETEYLWFVDDCLAAATRIVEGLGDELANRRPELPDANSPYAILAHCLGVLEFWGGAMVAGRSVERDRDAEFVAAGPVAEVSAMVRRSRERFVADLRLLGPREQPRRAVPAEDAGLPFGRTQAGVLMHVFHELAQHLGQLELTRDVLRAEAGPAGP